MIDWDELEQIRTAVDKINRELNTFERLLPTPGDVVLKHRRKRGLINFEGEILKLLFGVATAEQVQDIHNITEGIRKQDGESCSRHTKISNLLKNGE